MGRVETYLALRALQGPPETCGDGGIVRHYPGQCFVGLWDVLGHGPQAYKVAQAAGEYLSEHHDGELSQIMRGLHQRLKGTRGAVAALCRLNLSSGELAYVGVGNISVRTYGQKDHRFVSRDGIIGYTISTPREHKIKLQSGDLLVLSSDGVREHFNLEDYPGLLTGSAADIAVNIIEQLGKGSDDASCMVLRYKK